jgi:uncharacterized protein with GYD domain
MAWRPLGWPAAGNNKVHIRAGEGRQHDTYVSLINWTEQGIKNFRDTTQRADEFSKLVQSSRGRVRELLWTVGEYDIVCVADFQDDEAGVAALVRVGSAGNIRSKTLRAFDSDEMAGIIGRAG